MKNINFLSENFHFLFYLFIFFFVITFSLYLHGLVYVMNLICPDKRGIQISIFLICPYMYM